MARTFQLRLPTLDTESEFPAVQLRLTDEILSAIADLMVQILEEEKVEGGNDEDTK